MKIKSQTPLIPLNRYEIWAHAPESNPEGHLPPVAHINPITADCTQQVQAGGYHRPKLQRIEIDFNAPDQRVNPVRQQGGKHDGGYCADPVDTRL